MKKSRVAFFKDENKNGRLIGFVHRQPSDGYVLGVSINDPRPKTPVFVADIYKEEIQPGRIYLVDLVYNKDKNHYIAFNPNAAVCNGIVNMDGNKIMATIGKSTLEWDKDKPQNSPSSFITYVTNRKELKFRGEVFNQIAECFDKLNVSYT